MRKVIVCLCFCAPLIHHAQLLAPPIEAGESCVMTIGDYVDPGAIIGSDGQLWDYSGTPAIESWTRTILDAGGTVYGKTFSEATIAFDAENILIYYAFDDAQRYFGGVEGGVVVYYDDPEDINPYPFYVGDIWEDTFSAEFGYLGQTIYRTGEVINQLLASGQLIAPGGTVYDVVYRGLLEEHLSDSTSDGNVDYQQTSEYFYSSDFPVPIFTSVHFVMTQTPTGGLPEVTESTYSWWLSSYTAGVDFPVANQWGMLPNPANQTVTLVRGFRGPNETITFMDLNGSEVLKSAFVFGQEQVVVDVSALSSGIYMVQSGLNKSAQRLVITR